MNNIYNEFVEKIKLNKNTDRATLVYLYGDLGSGKTTFTKNLFKYLDLDLNITSPTFTILKNHPISVFGFENLIHIDTYRLSSYEELLKIKFKDYLKDSKNLIFVEWPDLIVDEDVKPDMIIRFEHLDKERDGRLIVID